MSTKNNTAFSIVLRRQRLLISVGIVSILFGVLLAGWVGYEWFVVGISHEVYALLAGVSALFGIQLLIFSEMASMLIILHREQRVYLDSKEGNK